MRPNRTQSPVEFLLSELVSSRSEFDQSQRRLFDYRVLRQHVSTCSASVALIMSTDAPFDEAGEKLLVYSQVQPSNTSSPATWGLQAGALAVNFTSRWRITYLISQTWLLRSSIADLCRSTLPTHRDTDRTESNSSRLRNGTSRSGALA